MYCCSWWKRRKLYMLPLWKHHRKFAHSTSCQPWVWSVCNHEGFETQSHFNAVRIFLYPLWLIQSRSVGRSIVQRRNHKKYSRTGRGRQTDLDGVRWLSCAGGHQRLSPVDCWIGKDNLPPFCSVSLSKVTLFNVDTSTYTSPLGDWMVCTPSKYY